jgi:hypothetical protein
MYNVIGLWFKTYIDVLFRVFLKLELQLMYKLMDRVPDGISSMLKDLEEHIKTAGLDDMKQWADVITQVSRTFKTHRHLVYVKIFVL